MRAAEPLHPSAFDSLDPDFVRAFAEFSEPDGYFRSDNLVSNEPAYLDVASELARAPGGVYLGVGPEQNFSYIAIARPELAVIVDIRRDNALLHLLYKAIFEDARDRTDFLCQLFSRKCDAEPAPSDGASVEAILDYVDRSPRDKEGLLRRQAALVSKLQRLPELRLSRRDFTSMQALRRQFMQAGPALSLEFHHTKHARFPTLAALLKARSPDEKFGSFLADEQSFRFVQELQRADRIQFVVGDFGKAGALRALARRMKQQALVLRTFYASNVETYLYGSDGWQGWLTNLRAFPVDGQTRIVRSYFVPTAQAGLAKRRRQPSSSFVAPLQAWLTCERAKPSKSYEGAVLRSDCKGVEAPPVPGLALAGSATTRP